MQRAMAPKLELMQPLHSINTFHSIILLHLTAIFLISIYQLAVTVLIMLLIEPSYPGSYMSKYRSLRKGGANVTKASYWHSLPQTDSN